ncbi:DUF3050 domain-containing protein [Sulfobacillus thermosulfidooxidans]|uniref:DUF3050 domain-containing protein n=1 Tax=Sulfobacillus thermosulfidooxidans TaxID=28034 RepID=UPI0002EE24E8|nr:DUF3050 domain-containing protein [Sulfobacillus thermosulfidooxidans]
MVNNYINDDLQQLRATLLTHPVYSHIRHLEDLRRYMQYHVFAVWDFMSLLKRLQQELTTVTIPWVPQSNELYTRFVNEIVLGEESDEDGLGGYGSHFSLYLEAMKAVHADIRPIMTWMSHLEHQKPWELALESMNIDERVKAFVHWDLSLATAGELYEVAAAFFFGREDIIPQMFLKIVDQLGNDQELERFRYYLVRHIAVDSDSHGPLAKKLVDHLCHHDAVKIQRAGEVARIALTQRIALFDAIVDSITARP